MKFGLQPALTQLLAVGVGTDMTLSGILPEVSITRL